MARSLGRNARNRLWSGLGNGKSAAKERRMQRSIEKRNWRRAHGA